MNNLCSYRIYFHGDFVGAVDSAMTREEAKIRFHNRNPEYALSGLMALEY